VSDQDRAVPGRVRVRAQRLYRVGTRLRRPGTRSSARQPGTAHPDSRARPPATPNGRSGPPTTSTRAPCCGGSHEAAPYRRDGPGVGEVTEDKLSVALRRLPGANLGGVIASSGVGTALAEPSPRRGARGRRGGRPAAASCTLARPSACGAGKPAAFGLGVAVAAAVIIKLIAKTGSCSRTHSSSSSVIGWP
jgi:hypothetical protein